ncbi:hypothetical protein D3C72_2110980 [compost metagenome]
MQQAQRMAGRLALVGQQGARQGAFGVHGDYRIHLGVAGVDARQVGGRHVAGADVAGGDVGAQGHGGHFTKGRNLGHVQRQCIAMRYKVLNNQLYSGYCAPGQFGETSAAP